MKMSVKSKLNFSNGRIAIAMLGVSVLTACGGGQGGMKMGDNEFSSDKNLSCNYQRSSGY